MFLSGSIYVKSRDSRMVVLVQAYSIHEIDNLFGLVSKGPVAFVVGNVSHFDDFSIWSDIRVGPLDHLNPLAVVKFDVALLSPLCLESVVIPK